MQRSRNTISQKIDHLFKTVRREDRREHTYDDVERGTEGRVSRSYVWKLRHGRNNNPSLDVIEALAQFFRVEPAYFFDQPEDPDHALALAEVAALLQDPVAQAVARHARGLSDASTETVLNLIDNLHVLEGRKPPVRSNGRH